VPVGVRTCRSAPKFAVHAAVRERKEPGDRLQLRCVTYPESRDSVTFSGKSRDAKLGIIFLAGLAVSLTLRWFGVATVLGGLLDVGLFGIGAWLVIRYVRSVLREAIWRLRNRLIVTYVFIAVVPFVLLLVMAGVGTYIAAGQVAAYLVASELGRRANVLDGPARFLMQAAAEERAAVLQQMAPMIKEGLPGLEVVVTGDQVLHYPAESKLSAPADNWKSDTGYLLKDGRFYCYSLAGTKAARVLLLAPINSGLLSKLVPGIGIVSFGKDYSATGLGETRHPGSGGEFAGRLPAAGGFWDFPTSWFYQVNYVDWEDPQAERTAFLGVETRPSAVLGVLFANRGDETPAALIVFLIVSGLLLIVLVLSGVVGVSLTSTITGAVHELYEGTTRVSSGDFAHRIPVKGADQLAALGTSFNDMTARVESLVIVAKEKERLQSEVEIASDVQDQLFPRSAPVMRTIELIGKCQPARMVSGDYYDYLCLPNGNLAVAIGDVAGKGISAALLMASIQSIMRTQLAAGGDDGHFSPSKLVAQLNRQLYANTAPEKYATFFFGLYDENSRVLTYTNAGHLPPLLLHGGCSTLLEVTGTVVGAFPSVRYEEQSIRIESGDVLVSYTDGITEPENDYGEEFGTEQLAETVLRHRSAAPSEIVAKIMEAVTHWSTAPELPDDMTVVIARGLA